MQRFVENFKPLDEKIRKFSLEKTIASAPKDFDDLWIFAYGSLMWDATFAHCEKSPAALNGWHRDLCVWTALARGTPRLPGLTLGLVPGGVCEGLAFKVADAEQSEMLKTLWEREVWTDVYLPNWVSIVCGKQTHTAITFTTNTESLQFAGGLSVKHVVDHVVQARGRMGTCWEYLFSTMDKLQALGINEPDLQNVSELARAQLDRR